MQAEAWIPIALSCVMAIIALITLARNSKKDTEHEAAERASMSADIKYIRGSIDEIKLENRAIRDDVGKLKTDVARIDMSVKNAHKRLDDMQLKGA